jgi:hypothetical protein
VEIEFSLERDVCHVRHRARIVRHVQSPARGRACGIRP